MPQNQCFQFKGLAVSREKNGEMTTVSNNAQSPEVGQFPNVFFSGE